MNILSLLTKYYELSCSHNKTGLLLLDLPTGFGKTYEVLQFIYQNYQQIDNKKMIFITNLKKNLPVDTLRKIFVKNNKINDFEKEVVFINSNMDCVLDNLLRKIEIIPESFKQDKEFKDLKQKIEYFRDLSQRKDPTSLSLEMAEIVKTDIQSRYEPAFRKLISNRFYEKGKTKEKRRKLLKNDKEFKWVKEIYPASLSFEKKIFFLSVDKFLVKNTPIVESSYYFFDNDFLKNAIIFIDEFDASKEVILKNIIETQLEQRIDIIDLVEQIYSSFNSLTIPQIFYENSQQWEKSKQKKSHQNIAGILNDLQEEITRINAEYNINYSVKTFGLNNQRSFLFHDYQYHTIVSNEKNFIYLEQDKDEKINNIHFVEPNSELKNKPTMIGFLTAIKNYLIYFKNRAKLIAENYQQLKKENSKENSLDDDFTFENALHTFFNELKLSTKQTEYLIDSIQNKKYKYKQDKNSETEIKNDFSFYSNGFCYYDFKDSELHDTKSKIYITDFDTTPEKFLLNLANDNFVIGISATAKIETVMGNYDLKYLRKNLREKFFELTSLEIQLLKNEFNKRNKDYVSIKAEFLNVDDWEKELRYFGFDNKSFNELLTMLDSSQNFEKKRYLKIAKVFQKFIQNDNIQSFLCFLNVHPKYHKSSCDLNVLEQFFKVIIQKYQKENLFQSKNGFEIKNSYQILDSKNFETKRTDILDRLKNGQKLFLITTYQTLGAGQNIQYESNNFDQLCEQGKIKQIYTPDYELKKLKDFDAIYLDKPTNLLVNIKDENLDDFNVNKRIFEAEMLFESNKIFYDQLTYEIKETFKQAYYKNQKVNNPFPKEKKNFYAIEDYHNFVAKEVIQALGRINRTYFKNSEIYIFADKEIGDQIKYFNTSNYLCSKEFEALMKEVIVEQEKASEYDVWIKKIEYKNMCCHKWIHAKINSKYWSEEAIKDWQELRNIVLKYPTISKQEFENLAILRNWQFIYLPMLDSDFKNSEPKKLYHFNQKNDFSVVKINFSNTDTEVSEEVIHLPELMKIKELREFFEKNNLATCFTKNDYMIAPEIFNNIYKGALGEVIGKFIFEDYITPSQQLQELPQKIFERFDFMLGNGIFVDFKFWNDENIQDKETQLNKIVEQKIPYIKEFKKVFIINILADSKFDIQISQQGRLVEVPYLIDKNTFTIDTKIVLKLSNLLKD